MLLIIFEKEGVGWGWGPARKTARETNSRQKRLSLIICLSAVSGGDDVFEDGGKIRGPRCGREKRGKGEWERENEKKKNKTRGRTQHGEEREESEGVRERASGEENGGCD